MMRLVSLHAPKLRRLLDLTCPLGLDSAALAQIATFCPHLEELRLHLCGQTSGLSTLVYLLALLNFIRNNDQGVGG